MAHGKETPRQKMIGMMYLVLTAMLALNVSKDILDAFVLVDDGLTKTTENFNSKNQLIYNEFDKLAVTNPQKVKEWKDKADKVKIKANELYDLIQTLKVKIIKEADDKTEAIGAKNKIDPKKILTKDDTNIPARIMVGANNNQEGKKLRKRINEYRDLLLSLVDKREDGIINSIKKTLDTSDPAVKDGEVATWETENFEHLPLIAVTTLMSKMQSDIRNAESDVIQYLYNKIEGSSFKFNKLEATVISNSNYILKGEEYSAEVFIAATDTTQRPDVYIGNCQAFKTADGKLDYKIVGASQKLPIGPDGKSIFKRTGSAVGSFPWGGMIELKQTDGTTVRKPFKMEYQVGEPTAVISPTKMNVLYAGLENPISISVAGVPAEKIKAEISNGDLKKVGNAYVAIPRNIGKATITVKAEIEKGKVKQMGFLEFRVKGMPPAFPTIGGRKGGPIDKNTLLAQTFVKADYGDNFEFDAKCTVTSFSISGSGKFAVDGPVSKSSSITTEQKEFIRNLSKGNRVYFEDIKAVGPDGKVVELNTIQFKIQ